MNLLERLLDGVRRLIQVNLAHYIKAAIGHTFLIFLKQWNLNLRLPEARALERRNFAFNHFSQFEKLVKIARGLLSDLFKREPTQFAQLPCRLHDERRLVALAPVRDWREVRTIRLDQHAVE